MKLRSVQYKLAILGLLVATIVAQGFLLAPATEASAAQACEPTPNRGNDACSAMATAQWHHHAGWQNECPDCPLSGECNACPSVSAMIIRRSRLKVVRAHSG